MMLGISIFLAALGTSSGVNGGRFVREEKAVTIDGVTEVWQLSWKAAPHPICDAEDYAGWMTCPCAGFAFGEGGDLDLLRLWSGREIDRLHLTPLFGNDRYDFPTTDHIAIVQRWDVKDSDYEHPEPEILSERVERRPVTTIIRLADYNHDGHKSEFFLQTGVLPCGKRVGVVIGVSHPHCG